MRNWLRKFVSAILPTQLHGYPITSHQTQFSKYEGLVEATAQATDVHNIESDMEGVLDSQYLARGDDRSGDDHISHESIDIVLDTLLDVVSDPNALTHAIRANAAVVSLPDTLARAEARLESSQAETTQSTPLRTLVKTLEGLRGWSRESLENVLLAPRESTGEGPSLDDAADALQKLVDTQTIAEVIGVVDERYPDLFANVTIALLRNQIDEELSEGATSERISYLKGILTFLIAGHRGGLKAARKWIVDATYDDIVAPQLEHLGAWIDSPTWEASRSYLTEYPEVLDTATNSLSLLIQGRQVENSMEALAVFKFHQELLDSIRLNGVDAAYTDLARNIATLRTAIAGPTPTSVSLSRDNIDLLKQGLGTIKFDEDSDLWIKIRLALAGLLWQHREKEDPANLELAIGCADSVLSRLSREQSPIAWPRAQHDKGTALYYLARFRHDEAARAMLIEAISCFEDEMKCLTGTDQVETGLAAQSHLGLALIALADRRSINIDARIKLLKWAVDNYDDARTMCSRETYQDMWLQILNNQGIALGRLAYLQKDDDHVQALQRALDNYDEACLVWTKDDYPHAWATCQVNRGAELLLLCAKYPVRERVITLRNLVDICNETLPILRDEGDLFNWGNALRNKGEALSDLANILSSWERTDEEAEALACWDAALTVFTRELFPTDYFQLTRRIGFKYFWRREWEDAARYLGKTLDVIEDQFQLSITSTGQHHHLLGGGTLAQYVAYALVRAENESSATLAAEVLDRWRARVTGELEARHRAQVDLAGLDSDWIGEYRRASERLAAIALNSEWEDVVANDKEKPDTSKSLLRPSSPTQSDLYGSYERAKDIRADYDYTIASIRKTIPNFLRTEPVVPKIVKELSSEERFCYLACTALGSAAILVAKDPSNANSARTVPLWDELIIDSHLAELSVALLTIPFRSPQDEVAAENGDNELDEDLTRGWLSSEAGIQEFENAVERSLGDIGAPGSVLAQVADLCRHEQVQRLILIPCGEYGVLPVHCAMVPITDEGDREPLQDTVRVNLAPSAGLWLAARHRATAYPKDIRRVALAVGNPLPQAWQVKPLPNAGEEVRLVSDLIANQGNGEVTVIQREAATRGRVMSLLQAHEPDFTHIHFACHAISELDDPAHSGLLLAHGARLMVQDLRNPANELNQSHLRLVVLSACETGLSGLELLNEAVALSTSWLQVGAIGVLASFWPVSDRITAVLMGKFYELHLIDELDPTEALWLAQRWVRGVPTWRQDFQRAGANKGAAGPEAAQVVKNSSSDAMTIGARHWAAFAMLGAEHAVGEMAHARDDAAITALETNSNEFGPSIQERSRFVSKKGTREQDSEEEPEDPTRLPEAAFASNRERCPVCWSASYEPVESDGQAARHCLGCGQVYLPRQQT